MMLMLTASLHAWSPPAATDPCTPVANVQELFTSLGNPSTSCVALAEGHYALEEPLQLTRDLTITTQQGGVAVIDTGGHPSKFDLAGVIGVAKGATVTLVGLNITGGMTDGSSSGGGVLNHGMLSLYNFTICGNTAPGQDYGGGGGIFNDGTVLAVNGSIHGNVGGDTGGTSFGGGGVLNLGTMTLDHVNITGNRALAMGTGDDGASGGGILNFGNLTISYGIIAANTAGGYGGGVASQSDVSAAVDASGLLTVVHTSIYSNAAPLNSGIHVGYGGSVVLKEPTNNPNLPYSFGVHDNDSH